MATSAAARAQPGNSPISGTPPPEGTRWKKGQSGNPSGRRKSVSERCSEALERRLGPEEMAERLDNFIRAGSEKALLYAYNRIMGTPAQSIQISGDQERPLHGLIGVVARGLEAIEAPAPTEAEPVGGSGGFAGDWDDIEGDGAVRVEGG